MFAGNFWRWRGSEEAPQNVSLWHKIILKWKKQAEEDHSALYLQGINFPLWSVLHFSLISGEQPLSPEVES